MALRVESEVPVEYINVNFQIYGTQDMLMIRHTFLLGFGGT